MRKLRWSEPERLPLVSGCGVPRRFRKAFCTQYIVIGGGKSVFHMPFEHQFRFVRCYCNFRHAAETHCLRLRQPVAQAAFQEVEITCAGAGDENRHMTMQAEEA